VAVTTFSAGTTGFTPSTATSGAVTLAGTLATTNGGTGLTSFTANGLVYASSTSALTTGSALTFDGTNFATTGTASATKFIATGGTATGNGMYLPAANTLAFSTNGAERIRVDSSGLVGIGTSSPTRQLDVSGAGQNIARFTSSGASTSLGLDNTNANAWGSNISFATGGTISGYFGTIGGILGNTTQDLAAYANTGNGFRVYTNGNNLRAIVTSAGDVGIGTTSPLFRFDARGASGTGISYIETTTGNTNRIQLGATTGAGYINATAGSGSPVLQLQVANSTKVTLDTSGNLGIGTSSPAYPLHVVTSGTSVAAFRNSGAAIGQVLVGNTAADLALRVLAAGDSLIFSDVGKYLAFGTNGATERMRLDSSGNLGLGVTPSAWSGTYSGALQVKSAAVYSASDFRADIASNSFFDGSAFKYINTGFATALSQVSGQFRWFTAPSGTAGNTISFTQAMTLDASGNLLVGKTSVDDSLAGIALYGTTTGPYISATRNGLSGAFRRLATDGDVIGFRRDATSVGSISVTTTATAYNTSSDYRLKNITGPITNSGAYIDSLKPVEGTWKNDNSVFVGLIAHEVQEVSRTKVATGVKDGEEMQAMDYSSAELIANLIAEIQSLRARVAQLEAK
jgi:hypothetical protein